MKKIQIHFGLLASLLVTLSLCSVHMRAAETKVVPERIGIYDSRLVAYAHFWTEANQRELNKKAKAAKDAKTAGQTARSEEISTALKKEQERIHRQVFSTAPVDDVLAHIKTRLPEIQKEAGVSKLVSKWDEATLKQHSKAQRVDVTDLLVREFKPGEKQLKVIADLKTKKPMRLDEIDKLERH
jgi:hypothetical protein